MSSRTEQPMTAPTSMLDAAKVNVRVKIAAAWTAMMFVFAYVDLFSLYRADVRADLEGGRVAGSSISQGFLLGATTYVVVPSAMVFLSLTLPAWHARWATIVVAVAYILTIAGSAVGESHLYYLLGSTLEVLLLAAGVGYAWAWPRCPGSHPVSR